MPNGQCEVREIRFVIEPELTQMYVFIQEIHNCDGLVQGWHHKTFSSSKSCVQILQDAFKDSHPMEWPLNAPPTR